MRILSKKRYIYGALIVVSALLVVVSAIPTTRYVIPGLFVKKDTSVIVFNVANGEVVPGALVVVDGKEFVADSTGLVKLVGISAGNHSATVSSLFYGASTIEFYISPFGATKQQTVSLQPKGEIVKVLVKNQFNSVPMNNVSIVSDGGGSATTNARGEATVLLASNSKSAEATISGDGILTKRITILSSRDSLTNVFYVAPAQKLFYKRVVSGKLEIVSAYSNGTESKTVIPGDMQLNTTTSRLFTSPDTKHAAFYGDSQTNPDILAIVSTTTEEVVQLANTQETITPIGWLGSSFYYTSSTGQLPWSSERQLIKMYDAATKTVTTIDTARSEGVTYTDYAAEYFGDYFVLNNQLVYTKYWKASYYYGSRLADKRIVVQSVKPGQSAPEVIQSWQAGYDSFIKTVQYSPTGIYAFVQQDGVQNSFWTYNGATIVANLSVTPNDFTNTKYPKYQLSPTGIYSTWQESSNGKNVIFIADNRGQNKKQISVPTDFEVVSWLTEDYVVIANSKKELFIMGRDGLASGDAPSRIVDAIL